MAEPKTDQEPSIEEILESIRQIISDDAPAEAAAKPAAPAPAPAPQPAAVTLAPQPAPAADDFPAVPAADEDDDEILDLTDKAVPGRTPVIEMQDQEEEPPAPPQPVYTPPPQPAPVADTGAGLLSDVTADVSAHAMARLLAGNVAVERDLPGRVGNVTLEDMTRELLRPMLKTWLDQNLPGIIERMVAKEIEKISRMAMKQ